MSLIANMSSMTIIDNVIIYAGATAIGTLLVWIGKSVAVVAKNQSAIHDQVMGVPEIGYPSMRDQFTEIRNHLYEQDVTLEKLEHEVQDNSGSSLKDAVKLVNKDINNIRKEIASGIAKNTEFNDSLQKQFFDIDSRLETHIKSIKLNNN
jgi:hypothetical protein